MKRTSVIELETIVKAPTKLVFDLARSVDLHVLSTGSTKEKAVGGKTSGLMNLSDTVTWEARHFGIMQRLTTIITEFNQPTFFVDEMVKGAFHSFRHDHHFEAFRENTIMKDVFQFISPFGFIGVAFNYLVLRRYMTKFLIERNTVIKQVAESGQWKTILNNE